MILNPRHKADALTWCFALNEPSLVSMPGRWEGMICAAVESARRHTRLQPVFIFDGDESLRLVRGLRRMGVDVLKRRVSFYDVLAEHRMEEPAYLRTAAGAFLRVELPAWMSEATVLYTDCDVLFRSDPVFARPDLVACAPEFDREDRRLFNTGVMVMELKALGATLPQFISFIKSNLERFATFDQDAYRQFYGSDVSELPLVCNWRPYWGPNPQASIVHYHGPKPQWVRRQLEDVTAARADYLVEIFNRSVDGYRSFMAEWIDCAETGLRDAGLDPGGAIQT